MTSLFVVPSQQGAVMIPLPTRSDPDGLTPELVKELEGLPPLNVPWMLARTGWLDEIMTTLAAMFDPQGFPARDREIMALRISTLLGAEYPVPQHRVFARTAGIMDQEIQAVIDKDYSKLDAWAVELCNLCEEISDKVTLSEASVQRLSDHYGRNAAVQAIWLMSWFNMLARFVSSTRIPIENPEVLSAGLRGNSSIATSSSEGVG
jgi:alkylhydroperoxidase family enzyme